ncbi:MAG: CocE/NonD family hydrolase [Alphaproteobacteria bacterium]
MQADKLEIEEFDHVEIKLSDGCTLSARMWLPKNASNSPVPAVLEYLPYRKRDGTCARDALTHPYIAEHGYACLRVDVRGNGDSEGVMLDEYAPQELNDAVEVIQWICDQPWCSGNVGMMGISWGGFNSLQVAAMAPPALKAIVTLCSTVDRFADDIHYKGGCLLNENLGWAGTMLSYSSRPPDPALVGDKWKDMWLERLEAEPHLAELWLSHQHRDAYWQHGSVCQDYSKIKAATLAVGGWGDAYKNAVPALVENLQAPVKGIVGPWIHKYPHFAVPEPRIGFLQEALRWWDRWLKGIDTGVEQDPDLRYYLMGSEAPKSWYLKRDGRWVDQKPAPENNQSKLYHFTDNGLDEKPSTLDALVDSPQDCGMMSGEYCAIWLGPELPGDQRRDDVLSVCFDSPVLERSLAHVGRAKVRLKLVSDQPTAQLAVRLCEVQPNGASTRVTYGVLNLCHRNSAENPEPLPVGREVTVEFSLDEIAYDIAAGNRLRVAVSNAYWPLIWPTANKTTLRLVEGSIELPLLNDGGRRVGFEEPEAAAPWAIETLRPAGNKRRTELDAQSGQTCLHIYDDFGQVKDLDHGLITGGIARETWSIDPADPLSAKGDAHWSQTLERGDWSVRTETYSSMTSDAQNFYLTARIEAFEGEELVFGKDLQKTIKRDLV